MGYVQTLITVSADCPLRQSAVPQPVRGRETVACIQHRLISSAPYRLTEEELLFSVYCIQNTIPQDAEHRKALWSAFFSTPKACLRASPLPKNYGWGIHYDADGKIALYAMESEAYQRLLMDDAVVKRKGMRSAKR